MNRRDFVGVALPLFAGGTGVAWAQSQRPRERGVASEKPPRPRDDDEKKILDVLDDLDNNERRGNMNVPLSDARLLRILTAFSQAKHVVELGTSNGYSGIWFCLALRGTGGKLTTFDQDPGRIKLAKANFKRAGVQDLVTLIEGDAHETVHQLKKSIDLLFYRCGQGRLLRLLEETPASSPRGRLNCSAQYGPSEAGTQIRRNRHHRQGSGNGVPEHAGGGSGTHFEEELISLPRKRRPPDGPEDDRLATAPRGDARECIEPKGAMK